MGLGSYCAIGAAPFVAVNVRNGTWGWASFLRGRPRENKDRRGGEDKDQGGTTA